MDYIISLVWPGSLVWLSVPPIPVGLKIRLKESK